MNRLTIRGEGRKPHTNGSAVVDHQHIAWSRVQWTAYLIHQMFHYEYPGPISDLRHRLVIIPPERHGGQRLITHRLDVSSPTTEVRREQDRFGNLVLSLSADHVAQEIDFTAWIVVERDANGGPIAVTPELAAGPLFRTPSPLTEPDAALRDAAESLGTTLHDVELAERINHFVYGHMRYVDGVTNVRTRASDAFALRQGVCQDYAHVMLALCRLRGLPARYISGHLLGEGGTHAWVEVLLPDPQSPYRAIARALDPTHNRQPGLNYVTVAIGRDYGDVAPTSGTYRAPFAGRLTTRKHAGLTAVEYLPDVS